MTYDFSLYFNENAPLIESRNLGHFKKGKLCGQMVEGTIPGHKLSRFLCSFLACPRKIKFHSSVVQIVIHQASKPSNQSYLCSWCVLESISMIIHVIVSSWTWKFVHCKVSRDWMQPKFSQTQITFQEMQYCSFNSKLEEHRGKNMNYKPIHNWIWRP